MTLQEYVISLQNQNLSQEEIYTKVEEWKKNNPQPQVEEEVEEVVEEDEEEFVPFHKRSLYGGLPLPTFHKDQIIISYVMADYYMKHQNDDSLKKALDAKIEEYITTNDITVEKALESLMFDDDNLIVDLAEQELANE